jgi:hypothetical protein
VEKWLARTEDGLVAYQVESRGAVKARHVWTGLLVGNGASIAVWPQFGYTSLYKRACSFAEIFSDAEVEDPIFFDATTHPLGDLSLLIRVYDILRISLQVTNSPPLDENLLGYHRSGPSPPYHSCSCVG